MRFFWALIGVGMVTMIAAASLAQVEPPKIREFDIATLEKLAMDMYLQDQEAWKAADALLAQHPQAELAKERVRGWVVENRDGTDVVRFFRDGPDGPEAAYDVSFGALRGATQVSVPSDRRITATEKAKIAARTLAASHITQRCSNSYNTIVLKDPQSDGWLVWLMAATTDPSAIMVGIHYRFTISADGSQIVHQDALARGCMAIRKTDGTSGANLSGVDLTQIVSNIPVETTVFLSLQHGLPFFILTADGGEWQVVAGRIAKVGTLQQKSPDALMVNHKMEIQRPLSDFPRPL